MLRSSLLGIQNNSYDDDIITNDLVNNPKKFRGHGKQYLFVEKFALLELAQIAVLDEEITIGKQQLMKLLEKFKMNLS